MLFEKVQEKNDYQMKRLEIDLNHQWEIRHMAASVVCCCTTPQQKFHMRNDQ